MTICDYLLPIIDVTISSVKNLTVSLDHIIERGTCIWKRKHEYSISRSTLHSDTEWQVRGQVPWREDCRSGRWWAQVVCNWKDRIQKSIKTWPGLHIGTPFTHSAWPDHPPPPPGNVFMCPTPSRCLHFQPIRIILFIPSSQSKNVFKCPGYSGRAVGPIAVWNKSLRVGESTGANRKNRHQQELKSLEFMRIHHDLSQTKLLLLLLNTNMQTRPRFIDSDCASEHPVSGFERPLLAAQTQWFILGVDLL